MSPDSALANEGPPIQVTRPAHISLGPHDDQHWWIELEEFCGPTIAIGTAWYPRPVANPDRTIL